MSIDYYKQGDIMRTAKRIIAILAADLRKRRDIYRQCSADDKLENNFEGCMLLGEYIEFERQLDDASFKAQARQATGSTAGKQGQAGGGRPHDGSSP